MDQGIKDQGVKDVSILPKPALSKASVAAGRSPDSQLTGVLVAEGCSRMPVYSAAQEAPAAV